MFWKGDLRMVVWGRENILCECRIHLSVQRRGCWCCFSPMDFDGWRLRELEGEDAGSRQEGLWSATFLDESHKVRSMRR